MAWWSRTGADVRDVGRLWQALLRRLDLEHTFRLLKQVFGQAAATDLRRNGTCG